MQTLNLILAIVAGVGVCVPLVIHLIKYIKLAIKDKDFDRIMRLVLELMPEAEEQFSTGAEKKEYVMNNIVELSSALNYKVDVEKVSDMIDAICYISKHINK